MDLYNISLCIFFLALAALVITLSLHFARRGKTPEEREAKKKKKEEEEEEYFKRVSTKNYHKEEKPRFDKDYFKREEEPEPQEKIQEAPRTTTTSEGVTIIDERQAKSPKNNKIFNDDEGEYVEFVEEK